MTRPNTLADLRSLLESHRAIDPVTGCWLWTKGADGKGYGAVKYGGRQVSIHRLSAHIYLGFPLEDPRWVLHDCDTPRCFNPEHFFYGDAQANNTDAHEKGRYVNGRTILSAEDVSAIRQSLAAGVTQQALADAYGVKRSAISKIATGRTWKDRG